MQEHMQTMRSSMQMMDRMMRMENMPQGGGAGAQARQCAQGDAACQVEQMQQHQQMMQQHMAMMQQMMGQMMQHMGAQMGGGPGPAR
jgi:hypothetical protein